MIPKEFWERFKNEKIAVNCQTEDEAKDFVKQCYDNGIEWFNPSCISNNDYDLNTTCHGRYKHQTYYKILFDLKNRLSFTVVSMNYCEVYNYTIIPFSEINKPIKEENKMQFSPNGYSYRGQVFRDIEDYAKYILKCAEDDKAKAEKEKQNKLKAEKARRTEELDKAYAEYFETCTEAKEKYLTIAKQYNKDYGVTTSCSYNDVYPSNYFQDIIDKMLYGK